MNLNLFRPLAVALMILGSAGSALTHSTGNVDHVKVVTNRWFLDNPLSPAGWFPMQGLCGGERVPENYAVGYPRCQERVHDETDILGPTRLPEAKKYFIYELVVKNTGTDDIRSVTWEYDFFDTESEKLLQRHIFTTETALEPGETVVLTGRSLRPPTAVIRADQLNKKDRDVYREETRVVSISAVMSSASRSSRPVQQIITLEAPDK